MRQAGVRSLSTYWDRYYRARPPIWDSDRPTSELQHAVSREPIRPCRTLGLGCGTGTNAVWLARQGLAVPAIDISPTAVRRARRRAADAGAVVRFACGDLREARWLGGPFDLFVD